MIPAEYVPTLRLLGAAYPTHPLDEMTLEAYSGSLARAGVDPGLLAAAAVRWMETEERYPAVSRLIDACRAEAKRRRDAARLADENAAYARGVLPGVAPAEDAYSTEMIDVLATALARTAEVPHLDRAAAVEREVAELLERRGLRPSGPISTVECRGCRDTGMHVIAEEPFTVRPCRVCNPKGFARWEGGHLRPGHNCSECDEIRRGRVA